jgi:hypothetical protein
VTGMEKLLARVKALFAPSPSEPPQAPEITPTPAETVAEIAETPPVAEAPLIVDTPPIADTPVPEPTAAIAEPPPAKKAPILAEAPPPPVEEDPAEEARAEREEAPAELESVPTDGLILRLETERGSRSTFQVTKTGATIGRGPESTIQLPDLSVSRKHARITFRQGAYWLSDLGSMGGTWINGTKLAAPRRVATGQTIDIGVCRLRVVATAEGEKSGAAKGPSNAA